MESYKKIVANITWDWFYKTYQSYLRKIHFHRIQLISILSIKEMSCILSTPECDKQKHWP